MTNEAEVLSHMAAQFARLRYVSFYITAKENKITENEARVLFLRAKANGLWDAYLQEARANIAKALGVAK